MGFNFNFKMCNTCIKKITLKEHENTNIITQVKQI